MSNEKAIAALQAYGYIAQAGGIYAIPGRKTQVWQAGLEGFTRFDPGESVPTPYRGLTAGEAQAAGSFERLQQHNFRDPAHNDLFVWIWPAEEIERIYTLGLPGRTAEPSDEG